MDIKTALQTALISTGRIAPKDRIEIIEKCSDESDYVRVGLYAFHGRKQMLTFEKVLEIFADYLTADETIEVYISRHGCVRVEFDQDFHYCSGEVCHTPKELFDLLADDYRTYLEIELTKGKREVTEDDEREADALCKQYLERWKEEQK